MAGTRTTASEEAVLSGAKEVGGQEALRDGVTAFSITLETTGVSLMGL